MTYQEIYLFQRSQINDWNQKAVEFCIDHYLKAVRKGK